MAEDTKEMLYGGFWDNFDNPEKAHDLFVKNELVWCKKALDEIALSIAESVQNFIDESSGDEVAYSIYFDIARANTFLDEIDRLSGSAEKIRALNSLVLGSIKYSAKNITEYSTSQIVETIKNIAKLKGLS